LDFQVDISRKLRSLFHGVS